MRHEKLLSADKCLLMVIDLQEGFKAHIPGWEQILERSRIMIEAAKLLEVPIIVTEQYPQGLGRTVDPLRNVLGECKYYEKVTFSSCQDETIRQALLSQERNQLLLVGIETHVCLAQTACDALSMGLQPFLAVDAMGSRHDVDHQAALDRLRRVGAIVTTTEAAIMEMTASGKHLRFREISKLIK